MPCNCQRLRPAVLQHTLDIILHITCVGKGAKSNCRSQEQAESPQSCMTRGFACASWLLLLLAALLKGIELSFDSSTPEISGNLFKPCLVRSSCPNTIRYKISYLIQGPAKFADTAQLVSHGHHDAAYSQDSRRQAPDGLPEGFRSQTCGSGISGDAAVWSWLVEPISVAEAVCVLQEQRGSPAQHLLAGIAAGSLLLSPVAGNKCMRNAAMTWDLLRAGWRMTLTLCNLQAQLLQTYCSRR